MRLRTKILLGLGGALAAAAAAAAVAGWRGRYEEPAYEAVEQRGPLEVRRYASRVVAETFVEPGDASAERATSVGFSRLANYIFGGNDGGQSIAMTTPVERAPVEGTRIAMTSPVERVGGAEGWTVTFTMPSEFTLATLPQPNDPLVTLRELPPRTVAVLTFSGKVDEDVRQTRIAEARELVREQGLQPAGEPTVAQYDPPWTPWFLRRNEVQIPLEVSPRDDVS
ncbi:MAG: heme-binding protein [Sandaracinaceae bacterium]